MIEGFRDGPASNTLINWVQDRSLCRCVGPRVLRGRDMHAGAAATTTSTDFGCCSRHPARAKSDLMTSPVLLQKDGAGVRKVYDKMAERWS